MRSRDRCARPDPPGVTGRGEGEEGVVAGAEAVILGTLVFVVGTLLLVSMWTIVDAKLAVEVAAREAARAVVEAPASVLEGGAVSIDAARSRASTAAVAAMTAQRGAPDSGAASWSLVDVALAGDYRRCGRVEATVSITVDTPNLPFIGRRLTAGTMAGSHVERIEPYRAGLPVADGGVTC